VSRLLILVDTGLMNHRIVRMSSWRGQITIAGEWRGCDYNRGMIEGFLEDVKTIMLSIV
jgi:hypothetical protein